MQFSTDFDHFTIADPGVNGYSGYAAGGFAAPVQSGFVDPNQPNRVYIPPNEQPPSYDESVKKNN